MLSVIPILMLLAWFALPVVVPVGNLFRAKPMNVVLLYFLTTCLGCCVCVAAIWLSEYQLQLDLNQYDLDGDGGFSEAELTPEAEKALDDWANDAAVGVGAMIGVVATIAGYAFAFAICWILATLAKRSDMSIRATRI